MIHVVALIGSLLDTVPQAPIIVQCSQSVPEPEWKSWLGVWAPWVGPLLSGVVSIYVAWRVFSWHGKKDRQQWVLDHKSVEWRELLKCTAEMQRVLRMESMTFCDRAREIADKLKSATHELSVASVSCVFLQDFFLDADKSSHFFSFLLQADQASESINDLLDTLRQGDPQLTPQERSKCVEKMIEAVNQVTGRYLEFSAWLRKEAAISLGAISDVPNVPLMPAS